jgi:hypothetical protein
MLCDKVDDVAVAGGEADARHCASLSLLEAQVSELCTAVSNRTANYHELTNVGGDSAH